MIECDKCGKRAKVISVKFNECKKCETVFMSHFDYCYLIAVVKQIKPFIDKALEEQES